MSALRQRRPAPSCRAGRYEYVGHLDASVFVACGEPGRPVRVVHDLPGTPSHVSIPLCPAHERRLAEAQP